MRSYWFIPVLLLLLLLPSCDADPTEPLPARQAGAPDGWFIGTSGTPSGSYDIGLDRTHPRQGSAAAYLTAMTDEPGGFANLMQQVRADEFRGQRVRWAGWLRVEEVRNGAALWMRVDGPGVTQALDNMGSRPVLGTSDWREVSVVLDVPDNAIGLAFGVMLLGPGDVIADDFRLEIVGNQVPTTDLLSSPTASADSATIAAAYESSRLRPVNLDFEGLPGLPEAAVAFLDRTAVPFATVEPTAPVADLEPLRQMVGNARVVALGEGTHGTREFFKLKHRVFQFLVQEMGFTHFAIEATWPESNDVNRYVLTGEGDPARLLSNLYFWTWNTQEVLDLIEWMRNWNLSAAPGREVQFLGFDMQYPGAAMDTVTAFIARVDPEQQEFVSDRYGCLSGYRNFGPNRARPATPYSGLPASVREACRAGLREVFELLADGEAAYVAASSEDVYHQALRSARLVQQWEEMSALSGTASSFARDAFMAENTLWLLDRAGPHARMMLWAHNYHVSRIPRAQGDSLGRALGDDYVNLGFLFGTGSLTAVHDGRLQVLHANLVPDLSLEAAFLRTSQPRLLLDARALPGAGSDAAPLREPILMRSIGAVFDPAYEAQYFRTHVLPRHFDLLMFVAAGTATQVLPFQY